MKTAVLIAIITVTLMSAFLQVTANRKGVCFMRYSKGSGCAKMGKFRGKKVTFEDCCKSKGQGWSRKRKNKNKCMPCVEVQIATSYWASWGTWSECSKTCGIGLRKRTRKCISNGNAKCRGSGTQRKSCKKPPCAVDGGWTAWSDWGPCSATCGNGRKKQTRTCSNPRPQHGGRECQGSPETFKKCLLQKHCPIDGGWGEWSSWGTCSKTCDLGKKTRTRICDTPKPKYGGKPCNTTEAIGYDYCREERCGKITRGCDQDSEDCASGSGSGWSIGSGSGSSSGESGSGSISESGSGFASGEESSGDSSDWDRNPKPFDDEDFS